MNKNTAGLVIFLCSMLFLQLLLRDSLPVVLIYVGIIVACAVTIAMNLYENRN